MEFESRDIGQFIDDDGTPYLVFESRPSKGFYIAGLSPDYMDVVKEVSFIQVPLEGGAIVHYKGLYYAIGSELSGWRPNPNKYATATTLAGPWTTFNDMAPPETNTYGSQSTMLIKVEGSKNTTIIFMSDQWKPGTQWDSRYPWMPVEIGEGKLWLPKPQPWTLNIKTGEWKLADTTSSIPLTCYFSSPLLVILPLYSLSFRLSIPCSFRTKRGGVRDLPSKQEIRSKSVFLARMQHGPAHGVLVPTKQTCIHCRLSFADCRLT